MTESGRERPLMRATVGAWPWGNSTVRRRRKRAPLRRSLWEPISSKRRAPSPSMTGTLDDGVPDHVAKAAQAGEGEADLVPVGVEGDVVGCADESRRWAERAITPE